MSAYNSRPNWKETTNQEVFNSLSEMEKNMFDRMDMVESQGKRDKKVATLLTEEMVKAIDILNKHRTTCGIKDTNKYIFANQENGHLDSWQVINKVANSAGCLKPKLINSVSLRKYIATVSQVLDLNQGEIQWLSSHLSHTVKIHKDFYRLQEAAVEIGKVSKLLMLTENGDVAKYKGHSLEEIQIDDSVAFDVEKDGGEDIGEDDPLDDELTQGLSSEQDVPASAELGKPTKRTVEQSSVSSEQDVPASAEFGKQTKRTVQQSLVSFTTSQSRKRKGNESSRQKRPFKIITYRESDNEMDDSDGDPDFRILENETGSETDQENETGVEQPPLKRKKRWTSDENVIFITLFKKYVSDKILPPGKVIQNATKHLQGRSVFQIRTRIHNFISGKQAFI